MQIENIQHKELKVMLKALKVTIVVLIALIAGVSFVLLTSNDAPAADVKTVAVSQPATETAQPVNPAEEQFALLTCTDPAQALQIIDAYKVSKQAAFDKADRVGCTFTDGYDTNYIGFSREENPGETCTVVADNHCLRVVKGTIEFYDGSRKSVIFLHQPYGYPYYEDGFDMGRSMAMADFNKAP